MFYTITMSFYGQRDRLVIAAVGSGLSRVGDPAFGVDMVSFGLVYAVEREGDHVRVMHTLTSIGRPLGPVIEHEIGEALAAVDGVESIDVRLVFDPLCSPEKMSEGAKFLVGLYC